MADKEILDALLRMESQNRDDHHSFQTQLRGYASLTTEHKAKIEGLRRDVDSTCVAVDEHSKAISGIRGQWKVALAILVPVILGAGAALAAKLIGG